MMVSWIARNRHTVNTNTSEWSLCLSWITFCFPRRWSLLGLLQSRPLKDKWFQHRCPVQVLSFHRLLCTAPQFQKHILGGPATSSISLVFLVMLLVPVFTDGNVRGGGVNRHCCVKVVTHAATVKILPISDNPGLLLSNLTGTPYQSTWIWITIKNDLAIDLYWGPEFRMGLQRQSVWTKNKYEIAYPSW